MAPRDGREPVIDLRSDTVTLPPPAMREAMARAQVGDDVYGEDPTVNRLQETAAELLGKPAALFVPSGTMANLLAVLAQCPRGSKVLLGDESDMWLWEAGGAAVLGGAVYHTLPTGDGGELAIDGLAAAVAETVPDDPQCAPPALVAIENTHCLRGGVPLAPAYLGRLRRFCDERGLPLHLDGARLFNAAVALAVEPARLAGFADSVTISLSKGLAAPVGSLLAGSRELVAHARRQRKMLGGGMRQAGFLAAAGLFALERMVSRLADDHRTARRLADGLAAIPGLALDPPRPATNMVFFRLTAPGLGAADFIAALARRGVRIAELGAGRLRAVTHHGIEPEEVDTAVEQVRAVLAAAPAG